MKGKGLMTAALTALNLALFAAPGDARFEVEIKPEFVKPAVINHSKVPNNGYPIRQEYEHDWLMIAVNFKCEEERANYTRQRQQKKYATTYKKEWLDNVQLELRMVIDTAESGATNHRKSANRYVAMTGNTEFWTINTMVEKHSTRFYVPAQLLDRYAYAPSPLRAAQRRQVYVKSKKNNTIKLKQIYIEAVFKHQGQVIGSGYYNLKGKRASVQFNEKMSNASKIVLKNAILPRLLSPWALYYPDHYDVEKVPGY